MKRWKTRALPLLLAVLLLLPCLPAPALALDSGLPDVRCVCAGGEIALQKEGDETYLFLPAAADLHALTFTFLDYLTLRAGENTLPLTSGTPFDLTALFPEEPEDGVYALTMERGRYALPVKIMRSENISALFLTSADPKKDRAWVEQDKDNKAKGSAVMTDAGGAVLYDGGLKQIKGRGNSTWSYPKKPYQIKLENAADLMECGEPAGTWVLLANYYDRTLLRNRITFDLASELGLDYTPHSRPVDLYYDAEYLGSYLLSEKTELGTNRVDLNDLQKDIEEANPDVSDYEALDLVRGETNAGRTSQYVDGLQEPAQLSGGYLLEIDLEDRAYEEVSWFTTPLGLFLVLKSPEFATEDTVGYISACWQGFEDAAVNGGAHPVTGFPYTNYMDRESLAKCYLILELAMDGDAFRSSTYFYKPEGEGKLFAGPVWDFDTGYGLFYADFSPEEPVAGASVLGKTLLEIPDFQNALGEEKEPLHTLIRSILLSPDPNARGTVLRSLTSYDEEVAASRQMDLIRWPYGALTHETQRTTEDLRQIIDRRESWLYQEFGGTVAPLFADVSSDDWFAPSVEEAARRGLFQGVGKDRFAPNETMTRAMVTTVLYRIAGQPQPAADAPFRDVSPSDWYGPAAAWAAEQGVVAGYPDGTFRPTAPVTRQELVALMYRYALSLGANGTAQALPETFTDRDKVPEWAADAFAWAVENGLVTGTPVDGGGLLLSPQGQATRCQGAAMFLRLLRTLEQIEAAGAGSGSAQSETTEPETDPAPAEQTESQPAET